MYPHSMTYWHMVPYTQDSINGLYYQYSGIPNQSNRAFGFNPSGGGGFGNLLGMGSSIAHSLGHKELGGMLGMANSFFGKYGKHFTGLMNGFGPGSFNNGSSAGGIGNYSSGYPGSGMPTTGGYGNGFGFPGFMGGFNPLGLMSGLGMMGGGYPGAMGMGMNPGSFF